MVVIVSVWVADERGQFEGRELDSRFGSTLAPGPGKRGYNTIITAIAYELTDWLLAC